MNSKKIVSLRKEIDSLDKKILISIAKRMEVVTEIAEYKKKHHIPALDSKRWKEVVCSRVIMGKSMGLSKSFVRKIYALFHKQSLEIENKLINS